MRPIFLDFETYYSQGDYTLRKMTTEEYIRDPRFEAIGVSVAVGAAAPQWFPRPDLPYLLPDLDLPNNLVIAHHVAFDGGILGLHYDIHPAMLLCTSDMSRAQFGARQSASLANMARYFDLPDKGTAVLDANGKRYADFSESELAAYGDYCNHDVWLCREVFRRLVGRYSEDELAVLSQTNQMFTNPQFVLDKDILHGEMARLKDLAARRVEWLAAHLGTDAAGVRDLIMSGPKMAAQLEAWGVEAPMKDSPTAKNLDGTPKRTYAMAKTDEEFVELQDHGDERVEQLVTARLGGKSTIRESRTQRFIGIAERGLLPVPLVWRGARATGRWGGTGKLNAQNLLKERGPTKPQEALRRAMLSPPGYSVLGADSAQIEARCLPWMAQQDDVLEDFREGRDVYSILASRMFGVTVTKADKVRRQVGKIGRLSLGFQGGKATMSRQLRKEKIEHTEEEAAAYVRTFREASPHIVALWAVGGQALRVMHEGGEMHFGRPITTHPHGCFVARGDGTGAGSITMPSGAVLLYAELRVDEGPMGKRYSYYDPDKRCRRDIYGGKVIQNLTQALARDVLVWQAVRFTEETGERMALTVHDELVYVVADEVAPARKVALEKWMSTSPPWAPGLPLACEAAIGGSYGEV